MTNSENYFALTAKMHAARKAKDETTMMTYAMLALSLAPKFLQEARDGDIDHPKTHSHSLETALRYFTKNGIKGQVRNIAEIVENNVEFHHYRPMIEKSFKKLNINA